VNRVYVGPGAVEEYESSVFLYGGGCSGRYSHPGRAVCTDPTLVRSLVPSSDCRPHQVS
jgi:hypothetical protein